MFRNHHLSKPFQALCCPMPIHQYSKSGLKWNAPNAMQHLTHMPKHTNSLMSDHNFITIHWQTTSPHFLKRSLSFCTSRIHAHQSDHVVKIIMLQFLHSNYNNYTKNAKLKVLLPSNTFPIFSWWCWVTHFSTAQGNSLGFRPQIEGAVQYHMIIQTRHQVNLHIFSFSFLSLRTLSFLLHVQKTNFFSFNPHQLFVLGRVSSAPNHNR